MPQVNGRVFTDEDLRYDGSYLFNETFYNLIDSRLIESLLVELRNDSAHVTVYLSRIGRQIVDCTFD